MSPKPLIYPEMPPRDQWMSYLDQSYDAAYFSNYGPVVSALIDGIEADLGGDNKAALPVANATVGLQVVLQALGMSGKVLTQSFTFPATVNAIYSAGMVPVFIDVDTKDWHVSPEALRAALSTQEDVTAVMIVRTLGMCNDLAALEGVCAEFDVPLILDSAGCYGGDDASGRTIGLCGHAEVFSFHATKPFSTGEGGCVYGDRDLIDRCKIATNFGLVGADLQTHGTNAKMSEFAGAIALAQLQGFRERVVGPRAAKAAMYSKLLGDLNSVTLPDGVGSPAWQFQPVRMASAEDATAVIKALEEAGYMVRGYYRPVLHEVPLYAACGDPEQLQVSKALSEEVVTLPLHPLITDEDIETIVDVIRRTVQP